MVLVVLTALTVAWALVAKATDWDVAYAMVMVHAALACMGADSML